MVGVAELLFICYCKLHSCWLWVPLSPLPSLSAPISTGLYLSHSTPATLASPDAPGTCETSLPCQGLFRGTSFVWFAVPHISSRLSPSLCLHSPPYLQFHFYCHWYRLTAYITLLFWVFGIHASPTALNTPVLGSHQLSPNPKWLPLSQLQFCQICGSLFDLVARKCREFCHLSLASEENLGTCIRSTILTLISFCVLLSYPNHTEGCFSPFRS